MNMISSNIICSGYSGTWSTDATLAPAHNTGTGAEGLRYFYHTNHLGSASMITNNIGRADQHIQYLPFGELFVSQRNSTFDSRYKFSAKELDNETGYSYFGARYYDSNLSIWLSVDPLADQRSWVSPYSYCQNNPVGRVDPTGALDDDYKLIKRTGEIKLIRKTTDDFDRIFAQKGSKYDMNNPLILKKGILGKIPSGNILGHAYFSNNNGDLDRMYKFVASNSDVEWGFASFKGNNKNLSVLTTSHKYRSVSANPYKRILEDNPDFIMTQKSHSHPLNEITMQRGYDVTIPSGFNKNGSPNTNATKGDRSTYQSFENNFESRIPYSFELFVPSQPNLNIEYNNSQMFKSVLITP